MIKNNANKSSNISVNDLILFCIHSVILNSEQCSFDRLVKECFTLFPGTLRFMRYPIWPETYFILTKTGAEKAAAVSKSLRQGKLL
ncbi:MAG: hypothetical protein A2528_00565 [Candidatus Staskawiczbacteria bacterium RIFOXYD2_FULL_37_9]|uniref:Uncharacterized protein n=1 Tax=Candidatus Staskawiczbacteria bacterium RIFOXYB1_FULL_37_44 TaxID=1802223 RepID=A0A1G2IX03_9BACT|nr:MAG: hypothetical protein A2358_03995 [Candidatus Staskawiczbacteria bacterium RIFOXYB1_FULL_37_44]OGZ83793.1 MAG: hypothetical protein A2416_00230 [Candidatus Staskawiczbacteria bacterium RIFOXYC1_FULL_37_52]OGZ88942.1 MAG: hypothetical protein A2581_01720 [Candidatus Staskawiczbacteria bacterium RIFOXYD1_FULL_37_110]OGZ89585.1 MAG: hypothetical protein A2444_01465 [Candidatus Staskawiczbacteria bacterium RIFOXYC2_FULL_37_19]OGZ93272.1 MAG: hypothetical protein A2528_00565 [Candidatus Stask